VRRRSGGRAGRERLNPRQTLPGRQRCAETYLLSAGRVRFSTQVDYCVLKRTVRRCICTFQHTNCYVGTSPQPVPSRLANRSMTSTVQLCDTVDAASQNVAMKSHQLSIRYVAQQEQHAPPSSMRFLRARQPRESRAKRGETASPPVALQRVSHTANKKRADGHVHAQRPEGSNARRS
jgi:hypothetical protein